MRVVGFAEGDRVRNTSSHNDLARLLTEAGENASFGVPKRGSAQSWRAGRAQKPRERAGPSTTTRGSAYSEPTVSAAATPATFWYCPPISGLSPLCGLKSFRIIRTGNPTKPMRRIGPIPPAWNTSIPWPSVEQGPRATGSPRAWRETKSAAATASKPLDGKFSRAIHSLIGTVVSRHS